MQGALFSPTISPQTSLPPCCLTLCRSCDQLLFLQGRGGWGIVLFKTRTIHLRPRLELSNSCCTNLTGTSALGIFTHITKTEVASSPVFLTARMSDHRRASFLGTSQLKWLRASKALFQHLVELFQKTTIFQRKLKKFFRENGTR